MIYQHLRSHLVFAPNTSVGKSIVCTGLCKAALQAGENVAYLKPIGTGSGLGDDVQHVKEFVPSIPSTCLFHFNEPVSPHLAVERESAKKNTAKISFPSDAEFCGSIRNYITSFAHETVGQKSSLFIESAGGVHSPTLSKTLQLDAFRPLLPPTILVASPHLGGISMTISAYESLHIRGYQVDAVVIFKEDYYENWKFFKEWFAVRDVEVFVIEKPVGWGEAAVDVGSPEDKKLMHAYYDRISSQDSPDLDLNTLSSVIKHLQLQHEKRIVQVESLPKRASSSLWYPFYQHYGKRKDGKDVLVIDSAHGDFWSVYNPLKAKESGSSLFESTFDASASWWTQCLGHAESSLTLAASYASGRYGHVLFPGTASHPPVELAERLISGVGKGWAGRAFYSDNGSTGIEVGLKMGLRTYLDRLEMRGKELEKKQKIALGVLGFKGSYHGDTIGAMDASEPNLFNNKVEWYAGRGYWLDPPTIKIEDGAPVIRSAAGTSLEQFNNLSNLYNVESRLKSALYEKYIAEIESELRQAIDNGVTFGSLILEPIVMGAGGMLFVDPLYQRALIDIVRSNRSLFPDPGPLPDRGSSDAKGHAHWSGLPIIFDEVFVGLYRLGHLTTSPLLGVYPDISVHAKILSGGLVPLSITLAREGIFETFYGNEKSDALLHGHSYTAHAIGCSLGNKTLDTLSKMEKGGSWDRQKEEWNALKSSSTSSIWSMWSIDFVDRVSRFDRVQGSMAMGTVLVVYLKVDGKGGYGSTTSNDILQNLMDGSLGGKFDVHARPLGNVLYFMSSLNSRSEDLREVEKMIEKALE